MKTPDPNTSSQSAGFDEASSALRQKDTNMTDTQAFPGASRFEVRTTADSHFGWIRTRLSIERTMMAWLRTATALIGFGFAIVQFFERLQQSPEARSAYLPDAPIYLGMALIACGVLALFVAIFQYRWAVHYLWGEPFGPIAGMAKEPTNTPVLAIGVLLILIGLFAFFAVLLRLA
jgi:putative membrane protein